MKTKPTVRPARTKGDLKIIHADGTVDVIPKHEADLQAREIVRKVDALRERKLAAAVPIHNP